MQKTTLSLALAAAVFCVSPVYTASAEEVQEEKKESGRTYREAPDGEGALTREMIKACIALKTDIDAEYAELNSSKEQHDTLKKETGELDKDLQKNKEEAEKGGTAAVAEYNKKAEGYNSKIKELEEMEQAYNTKNASYEKKVDQFNKECNNQPYYDDDYAAMVEEMGRGM